jgi:hypothetical protein
MDARIPVFLGPDAVSAPDAAFLLDGERPAPEGAVVAHFIPGLARHGTGCACCVARGAAGEALGRLFLLRARGEVSFFRAVVVVCDEAGRAEVLAALAADPVVSARFRLA